MGRYTTYSTLAVPMVEPEQRLSLLWSIFLNNDISLVLMLYVFVVYSFARCFVLSVASTRILPNEVVSQTAC